mmetsp:Transcript_44459/g.128701  ORF Transcript_44459/g.128701 Transcript_44459/m.128701 type:complete len:367 (-) Transcript_44459:190-1290(-)
MAARLEHAQRLLHKLRVGRRVVQGSVADEQVGRRVGRLPRAARCRLLDDDQRAGLSGTKPRLEVIGELAAASAHDEQRDGRRRRGRLGTLSALGAAAAALIEEDERLRRRGGDCVLGRRARRGPGGGGGHVELIGMGRASAHGVRLHLGLAEGGRAHLGEVVVLGEALGDFVLGCDLRHPLLHHGGRGEAFLARHDARQVLDLKPDEGGDGHEAVHVADDRGVGHIRHPHGLVEGLAARRRGRHQRLDARGRRQVARARHDGVGLQPERGALVLDRHMRRIAAAKVARETFDALVRDALEETLRHDDTPAEGSAVLPRVDGTAVQRARRPKLRREACGVLGVRVLHGAADGRVARLEGALHARLAL